MGQDEHSKRVWDTEAERERKRVYRERKRAQSPPDSERDPLPPDIEAIWGRGRVDGTGCLAANTAYALIDAWGLEVFRGSAIHRMAIGELERDARLGPVRAAFVKSRR